MTEDEQVFEKLCIRADWYYSYSDDINVYRAGKAGCEQLQKEAGQLGGNFALIYKYYSTK